MGFVGNRKGIFSWRLERRAYRIGAPEDWIDRHHRQNSRRPESFAFFYGCGVLFERSAIWGVNRHGRFVHPAPVRIRGRWVPRRNAHYIAWRTAPRARRVWTSRDRAANSLNNRVLYPDLPF